MGRGIIIALAASLAANVFLGGFVAGRLIGGDADGASGRGISSRHGGREAFADLPPAARDSLKRAYLAHRAEGRGAADELKALHRDFVRVLSAEDFDRAAALAIADKADALERSGRTSFIKLVVNAADGLSVEDRKALARHIEARGARWKGRRHHRDGPPPEDADAPKEPPPAN